MSQVWAFHAEPNFCHHPDSADSGCSCPEYDDEGTNECALCEHRVEWHLPPLHLSHDEGRAIKARGDDALERCKNKLKGPDGRAAGDCPCPVFTAAGVGPDCGLCGCKKGWHKWKDQGQAPRPTSPRTPSLTSPSSFGSVATFPNHPQTPPDHTPRAYFGSPPHHSPPAPLAWDQYAGQSASRPGGFQPPKLPSSPNSATSSSSNFQIPPMRPFPTPPPSQSHLPHAHGPVPPDDVEQLSPTTPPTPSPVAGGSSGGSFASASSSSLQISNEEIAQRRLDKGKNVVRDPSPPTLAPLIIPSSPPPPVPPEPTRSRSPLENLGLHSANASRLSIAESVASFSGRRAPEDDNFAPEPVQPIPIPGSTPRAPRREAPPPPPSRHVPPAPVPTRVIVAPAGPASPRPSTLLEQQEPDVGVPVVAPGPGRMVFHEYETKSKNVSLLVSPGVSSGPFKPGQVFHLRVKLGPKVSLANFSSIEVALVGNTFIQGEPPDNHDFLTITKSILPLQENVTAEPGERVFSFVMTLPHELNCECRDDPLPLPASYTHRFFTSRYRFRLTTRKAGRLSMLASAEKSEFIFIVEAPFIEMPSRLPSPPNNQAIDRGIDGPWRTVRLLKLINVTGQMAAIQSSELAYQIIHPPEIPGPPGSTPIPMIHIPYRVSLNLGAQPNPVRAGRELNQLLLDNFASTVRMSLSRRIQIYKSGKGTGNRAPTDLRDLGLVLTVFKDRRGRSYFSTVEGRLVWRFEGQIEVGKGEGRSLANCNTTVGYVLSAKVSKSIGLTHDFAMYAYGVNLELTTANPEPPTNLARTDSSSGSVYSLPSVEPGSPATRPRAFEALTPLPIASGSGIPRGVQLTDGPRPPSIAGSSIYRVPMDERVPTPSESDDGVALGRPSGSSERLPDLLPPPTPIEVAPPEDFGPRRLEFPPDFEDEFPDDHEAAPEYTPWEEEEPEVGVGV
ncbi:hypothetical protein RQP46_011198 [Phenoliferia psychrophenolica]